MTGEEPLSHFTGDDISNYSGAAIKRPGDTFDQFLKMNCIKPGHRELCRKLFTTRYQERIQRYTLTPYTTPANSKCSRDTILPHLLNDKEFYQGRLYASNARLSLGRILWEAVGMMPDEFKVLCDMLVNPNGTFSKTYEEHPEGSFSKTYSVDRVPFMSLCEFFTTLKTWSPQSMGIGFRNVWDYLARYHLWLCQHNPDDTLAELWTLRPCHQNMVLPLEYGLMVYIQDEWEDLAWTYLDSALSVTPNPSGSIEVDSEFLARMQNEEIFDDKEGICHPRSVQVLFSAAGTGKTQHIFQLLQNHWGFYMVAPNLQPGGENLNTTDIIEPQRYFASRDTLTMFEDHPQMDPRWPAQNLDLFLPLVAARCALLYEFLQEYPQATPGKWLLLQIRCESSDPFDALYRLFRLSHSSYLYCDPNVEIHADIPGQMVPSCYEALRDHQSDYFNGTLYHCFDEAQVALDDAHASSMFASLYEGLGMHEIMTTSWEGMPAIHPTLVISGTSLRLKELKQTLTELNEYTWDEYPLARWLEPGFHDVFPLVVSEQDFWKLYEEHTASVLNELESTRHTVGEGHDSYPPLVSRSGRPLALAINQKTDFPTIQKRLRGPLDIQPLQDILRLPGQTYKFISARDQAITRGNKSPTLSLEDLLDRQSSGEVAMFLVFYVVTPLIHNELTGTGAAANVLLRLFADHGNMQPDQVLESIRAEIERPLTTGFSFADSSFTLHKDLRNLYMRSLIVYYSRGQRGRYRWSTNYIEEIMMLSTSWASTDSSLTSIHSSLEQAKTRSSASAVGALKSQIRKMKAANKTELVQDLFRAAIRAELLSTPTIFLKKAHADLVTYGFALVQRDGETMRYTLSEPIAVYAIMDYLRTEGGKDYEELMLQWLINTQDDYEVRSMFGKATEWFVAMSFDRLLRRQSYDGTALPDLLDGAKRRGVLLEALSEAIRLDADDNAAGNLGDVVEIDGYALPEVPTVFEYQASNTIWKWMRQFRREGPESTPTFMFPDINAGPDLIFVLEKQPSMSDTGTDQISTNLQPQDGEGILVAVQIKTGQSARFEDAMETLIESNWHKNMNDTARDEDMQELDYWKNVPILLLLICTGITVKQKKIKRWMDKNGSRIRQGRFICVLDETVTSDIWGEDLVTLANTIRRQNMQQQSPWEQDVRDRRKRDIGGVTWEGQLTDRSRKRPRIDE